MKIEYLGHACFRIDDALVIDPYKDGSVPGLLPLRTEAVEVVCSHSHADHSGVECVRIKPGQIELKIEEIPCWHDDQQGALRGPNKITIVKSDNEKLVHLGDLGHYPTDEQLAAISNADYLMIPVGGYYTIDAEMAVKICEACNPRVIIPMHYRTATSGYPELAEVSEFVKTCEKKGIGDRVRAMEI